MAKPLYYKHAELLVEKKIQAEETAKLRRELESVANEQNRSFCSIL
jgi:hypothetical protein